MPRVVALVLWLAACLCAAPAWAGRLVIQVSARAYLQAGRVQVVLTVVNRGDEAARDLQAHLLYPPVEAASRRLASLAAGGEEDLVLSWPAPAGPPGRYAAVVRVDFSDQNQYPFSTLAHALYALGRDRPSPLAVRAAPVRLEGTSATWALTASNPSPQPFQGGVHLFCPRELSLRPRHLSLHLPPRGRTVLTAELTNFSALSGASYPLVAVVEGRVAGRQVSAVVTGRVTLAPRQGFFRRTLGWWLAGAGLLTALWVVLAVRGRRRGV